MEEMHMFTSAIIAILLMGITADETKSLTIADQGIAQYTIHVHPAAPDPERHAADELARVLCEVSGAEFSVRTAETGESGRNECETRSTQRGTTTTETGVVKGRRKR
jgi:hypothetical protein